MHKYYATLSIPAKNADDLKKIFAIEGLLNRIGITFDTGYGDGFRDWELDWSLKGAEIHIREAEAEDNSNS